MRYVFFTVMALIAGAGLFAGVAIFQMSRSAIHESETLICLLISAVGFGAVMVASYLQAMIGSSAGEVVSRHSIEIVAAVADKNLPLASELVQALGIETAWAEYMGKLQARG